MINYSKGVVVSINSNNLTTKKDSDNKEHYCFTGLELCEVNVNWQAKIKNAQAEVDCSITFLVNEDGIKEVVGEPIFGGITDKQEVLELVRQNTEVFINGNSLYYAITKNVSSQTNIWNDSSSGYRKRDSISSLDSGIADLYSTSNGNFPTFTQTVGSECNSFIDTEFEGYGIIHESQSSSAFLGRSLLSRRNSLESSNLRPVANETEQFIKSVKELELKVDGLKQENGWLTKRKKLVEEERNEYELDLEKVKEKVEKLEQELNGKDSASKKRIEELLAKQDQKCKEKDRKINKITQEVQDLNKTILSLTKDLQAEKAKVFKLGEVLQAEQKKSSNLEKDLQDKKTKVFNLEKKLQDEHAKLSDLSKGLKSEVQKVADLKKRNSTNISKAKKALSIAALLMGLMYLFSQVQICSVLCVVFLISFVYCIYNIYTMNEEHDHHSHDFPVSRVDSMELEDCKYTQQSQIQATVS
ncbi:hypothetical protein [Wolbachia endosymbiont of Folsomia candida]|uniref:hypothetical protein n=1 Tax=Wolbachia endosymbiont of Folsomia candida TaxID=169402 RepID=UPI000A8A090D|nr:hypothetical protein [Wolbachia endosymbiont of Folsomia candida]